MNSTSRSKERLFFDFSRTIAEHDPNENNLDGLVGDLLDLLPQSTWDAVQPFDVGRLFFTGPIIDESVAPFTDDLYRVHLNLSKHEPIEVTLNSAGGDLYAGEAMIGAIQSIQSFGRRVNITVQGIAASMASVVLQVGTMRRVGANSVIMLHEVSSASRGKLSSQAEDLEASKRLQDKVFGYYAMRTNQPITYYHQKLTKRDFYLLADEALAEGLVDEIVTPPVYPVTPPKPAVRKKNRQRKVTNA